MKSIVFFNNKGGVGKTTLACNVVSYIAHNFSKKVLLIDADPQCNATQAILSDDICEDMYIGDRADRRTVYDVLTPLEMGEPNISEKISPSSGSENFYRTDLIPGHPNLSRMEDRLSEAWGKLLAADIAGFRITNWANHLVQMYKDDYDLIVFDVGPSLGALNRTVILACEYVVVPFGCDIFSILGINNISTWISKWDEDYKQFISIAQRKELIGKLEQYVCILDTSSHFRLAGYSVQQYVSRKFKEGPRPVKAYDRIMREIPSVIREKLGFITQHSESESNSLSLGNIPYVYSLVPLSQSTKKPIHTLTTKDGVVGSQIKQVVQYQVLMKEFTAKLLTNIGML